MTSDKALKSQLWDFGDGSPITNKNNPTHLYSIENQTNLGKYLLSDLIVEDLDGCFDTISYYIFVETDHYFWLPNSFHQIMIIKMTGFVCMMELEIRVFYLMSLVQTEV